MIFFTHVVLISQINAICTLRIYINLNTEFTYAESIYVNTLCVQDMHTQIPICIAKWS